MKAMHSNPRYSKHGARPSSSPRLVLPGKYDVECTMYKQHVYQQTVRPGDVQHRVCGVCGAHARFHPRGWMDKHGRGDPNPRRHVREEIANPWICSGCGPYDPDQGLAEARSNEGLISNPLMFLENPILFENPLSKGAKAAVGVGVVAAVGVIAYILFSSKTAQAAPQQPISPKGKFCTDGTPAPGDDTRNCPTPHPGQNPYSPPGGWQYSGNPSADYLPSAALLGAVNPCDCANVMLVRRFQIAAGLTQKAAGAWSGPVTLTDSDGRYGPDCQKALQNAISDIASQGYDVSNLAAPAPCEQAPGAVSRPSCGSTGPAWWGPCNPNYNVVSGGPNPYKNPNCASDTGPE